MNVAAGRQSAILASAVVISVLAACGQNPPQAPPSPPAPPQAPSPPPPATSTSPVYPSLGERPGDPAHIGPDDLRLAVDAAQTVVGGSRLVSVRPASAAGNPVWIVRLATEGPSVREVVVDAVLRGGKSQDVQLTEQDRTRVRDLLNAAKVFWPDAVKTTEKQTPDSVPGAVVLDGKAGNPTEPVWKITLLTGKEQIEYTVDAVSGAVIGTKASPKKPQDFG